MSVNITAENTNLKDKNETLEEQIKAFQQNLTEYLEREMLENQKEMKDNVHDFYLKSLDDRINEHLINLNQSGKILHTSDQDTEFFLEVISKYVSPMDNGD